MSVSIPIDDLTEYIQDTVREELKAFKLDITDEVSRLKTKIEHLQDNMKEISDIADDIHYDATNFEVARDEMSDMFIDICDYIVAKLK